MRYSLLDLVQNILSSMDSDEVNSINDTVESQQVVRVIKTVYDDILARGDLKINKTPFTLTASGDSSKPVLMTKPTVITNIEWIRYNCIDSDDTDPTWIELQYRPIDSYMMYIQQLNPSEATVDSFTHTTTDGFDVVFNYRNDTAPNYYTNIDDNTLIFDGYDAEVDSTLQASKTSCYGTKTQTFSETDSYVPELQSDQFSLLLNEAKSLAWAELKQSIHQKAEHTARKNWVHLAKTRNHVPVGQYGHGDHPLDQLINFSRK